MKAAQRSSRCAAAPSRGIGGGGVGAGSGGKRAMTTTTSMSIAQRRPILRSVLVASSVAAASRGSSPRPRSGVLSSFPAPSSSTGTRIRPRTAISSSKSTVAAAPGDAGAREKVTKAQPSHFAAVAVAVDSSSSSSSSSSSFSPPPPPPLDLPRSLARLAAATAAAAALSFAPLPAIAPSATAATDAAKVGTCLLASCPGALARCVSDLTCAKSLVCLNRCTGRPDETACQIKCGDLYADAAIETFNACAVSEQKCVPQRVDEGLYPIPPADSLDTEFDLTKFEGRWYITAGLNPLFDTFDCQRHFFGVPEPGRLFAKINWRISMAGNGAGLASTSVDSVGSSPSSSSSTPPSPPPPPSQFAPAAFAERSTVQTFVQDPANRALLLNHGNEYLHYEDDWYILASRFDGKKVKSMMPSVISGSVGGGGGDDNIVGGENDYVFVYYRGNNDAWRGYGGAVVYTRADSLPAAIVPELEAAAARAGLKWSDFALTDNKCLPPPPMAPSLLEEVEGEVLAVEEIVVEDARKIERVVEEDARKIERVVEDDARKIEKVVEEDARKIEREAAEIGAKLASELQSFGKFTVLPGRVKGPAMPARTATKQARSEAMKRAAEATTEVEASSSSSSKSTTDKISDAVKGELTAVERELEEAAAFLEKVEQRYAPAGVQGFLARLFGGGG